MATQKQINKKSQLQTKSSKPKSRKAKPSKSKARKIKTNKAKAHKPKLHKTKAKRKTTAHKTKTRKPKARKLKARKAKPNKRVLLIQGGMGCEREVSLETGHNIAKALDQLGYNYKTIDAGPDLPMQLNQARPHFDVAVLALHGQYGEDGTVQSLCEYLKLPYTGSGVFSSALCMDKVATRTLLLRDNFWVPWGQHFNYTGPESVQRNTPKLLTLVKKPMVVKAARGGSSLGVSIVKNEKALQAACKKAAHYDSKILIEEFIPGHDITVGVLKGTALEPIQIQPKHGFYDYTNKYTAGKTNYLLPAPLLSAKQKGELCDLAQDIFKLCQMRGYGRVDFRMDDNRFYVIEVNTLPGLTNTSLVPKAAEYINISFEKLIDLIIQSAGLDYPDKV